MLFNRRGRVIPQPLTFVSDSETMATMMDDILAQSARILRHALACLTLLAVLASAVCSQAVASDRAAADSKPLDPASGGDGTAKREKDYFAIRVESILFATITSGFSAKALLYNFSSFRMAL
jgi:hypothetical protein